MLSYLQIFTHLESSKSTKGVGGGSGVGGADTKLRASLVKDQKRAIYLGVSGKGGVLRPFPALLLSASGLSLL